MNPQTHCVPRNTRLLPPGLACVPPVSPVVKIFVKDSPPPAAHLTSHSPQPIVARMNVVKATHLFEAWLAQRTHINQKDLRLKHSRMRDELFAQRTLLRPNLIWRCPARRMPFIIRCDVHAATQRIELGCAQSFTLQAQAAPNVPAKSTPKVQTADSVDLNTSCIGCISQPARLEIPETGKQIEKSIAAKDRVPHSKKEHE